MIVTRAEVKEYLRIDNDDEDLVIDSLIKAAEEYITTASGIDLTQESVPELAKMAVKLLTTHWYENREAVGQADGVKFSLESILFQLKWCGN